MDHMGTWWRTSGLYVAQCHHPDADTYDLVVVKLSVEKYYYHLCVRIKCCQKEVLLWLQVGTDPHAPPPPLPTFLFLPSRWSCRARWAWTAPSWPCRTICSSTTTPSTGAGPGGWNRGSRWRTLWNTVSQEGTEASHRVCHASVPLLHQTLGESSLPGVASCPPNF